MTIDRLTLPKVLGAAMELQAFDCPRISSERPVASADVLATEVMTVVDADQGILVLLESANHKWLGLIDSVAMVDVLRDTVMPWAHESNLRLTLLAGGVQEKQAHGATEVCFNPLFVEVKTVLEAMATMGHFNLSRVCHVTLAVDNLGGRAAKNVMVNWRSGEPSFFRLPNQLTDLLASHTPPAGQTEALKTTEMAAPRRPRVRRNSMTELPPFNGLKSDGPT